MTTRYLTAAVLCIQVSLLVLAQSCCVADGLSLDGRLLQLQQLITDNYVKLTDVVATKDARLEVLELKVIQLEEKVQQQQQFIITLQQNERDIASHSDDFIHDGLTIEKQSAAVGKIMFPRTCREVRATDPSLTSGMHWIDPDGQGVGDDPIYVYCDMTKGSTSVLHDSESSIDVGHCADPGCYSRAIKYNATLRQIEALAELSNECHQSIKYDCNFAPFEWNDITYAWWNDRNGDQQNLWAGNNASVHTCQCGIDQNCVDASATCNCDSGAPVLLTDSGDITAKSILPVTRLNFGRTQLESSSGAHTLGRFECSGQVAVSGMPKSCTDLWHIGHSLNGLYSVMGLTQLESVYCDFTKLPDEPGFQNRIGYFDVKSSPVYFYVQRSSNFGTKNVPIPFDVARLNVGGAMDLASGIFTAPQPGTYFFAFSGLSTTADVYIGLFLNDNFIGTGHSHYAGRWETLSFQSTLQLNAGDKISLKFWKGEGSLVDYADHLTHFTGWLQEENLTS